jgi:hypothetical protein
MKPIDLFQDALNAMLKAHGLTDYDTFDLYDLLTEDQEVTGYAVVLHDQPFTMRQAQDVALALSAVPGTAYATVDDNFTHDGVFGFYYHTGPAHAKLAAIAAMRAEVAA